MIEIFIHKFWFIQLLGGIGLLFSVFAWNAKERSSILVRQSIGSVIYIFHYVLLGAFTGAVMNGMVIGRNLLFNQKHKQEWAKHPLWLILFMLLLGAGGLLSWQGPISIVSTIGTMVGTYGMWQSNPWKMRFYIFIACVIWIPYTLAVHSYTGLISQLVAMAAIIVARVRLREEKPDIESV